MDISKESIDALITAFLDQIAAHFPGAAMLVDNHRILLNIGGKAVPISVYLYSEPSESDPERPNIIRISLSANKSLPAKQYLLKLGLPEDTIVIENGRPRRMPPRLNCILELNILPSELPTITAWFAAWLRDQAGEDVEVPDLPFEDSDLPSMKKFTSNKTQSAEDNEPRDYYAWSTTARYIYMLWEARDRAREADETQFSFSVYEDRYPDVCLPMRAPVYKKPDFPAAWFESGVEMVNRFRPGQRFGKYLRGPTVERQIAIACEQGYIVLPEGWKESKWWRAWNDTWFETCMLPKNRRPWIRIVVSYDEGLFGRKVVLDWDWITMNPWGDPTEDIIKDPRENPQDTPEFNDTWKIVFKRIDDYLRVLPAPGYQTICQDNLSETIHAFVGTLTVATDCDTPIKWIFDWMAAYYPNKT
jgi:hypothetical protein